MAQQREESDSDDEVLTPSHFLNKGNVETKGVKTHFWLERTYFDEDGIEHWQTEQEINQKLWQLTKIINLNQTKEEFPAVP